MTIAKARKRILRSGGYNYDSDAASLDSGALEMLGKDDVSKTVQSEKDNSDINVIVKRFGLTGQMPTNPRVPRFGDFEGLTDFQSAANAVAEAKSAFMELPAAVRSEFNNDPQQLLKFCADPRNIDRMRELGLANEASSGILAVKVEDSPQPPKQEKVNVDNTRSGVDSGKSSSGEAAQGGSGNA